MSVGRGFFRSPSNSSDKCIRESGKRRNRMNRLRNHKSFRLIPAAAALGAFGSVVLLTAQGTPKKPAVPAKAAAASQKPASIPAKPPGKPVTKPAATAAHPSIANPPDRKPPISKPTELRSKSDVQPIPPVEKQKFTTPNGWGTRGPDGQFRDLHDAKRGMDIHHGLDGSRRVSVQRKDGSHLVAERGRRGFVERPYKFHDRDFARRSYYYHGVRYDRFYNHYYYHGVYIDVYAPAVYYAPAFYGWAYNPWPTPIACAEWGWVGAPWYGFYGAYFTPWAVYPFPAYWLADYMLGADLQAVYAAQAAALAGGGAIQVPADQPWTDSGLQVVAGQTYTITAGGVINYATGNPGALATPDGRADIGGCRPGEAHPQNVAPALTCNALIGRVGPDGAPFAVGRATTIVPSASGELFLGVNDCIGCFGDNAGAWVAAVIPADTANAGSTQQADASGATPLTPEVKQAIADEIKNQLALENAEAAQIKAGQDVDPGSSGIQRIIQDVGNGHPHVFVAGDSLDVTNAGTQQECHLSEGDAVQMVTAPASDATSANVLVKSSKGGVECSANTTVAVNLSDLQEMQNHMREQIDAGLKEMQSKAGIGGLPQPPVSAKAAPSEPQYAAIAPPPSPQDEADIEAQNKEANAAENEAQQGGTPSASYPVPSVTSAENQIPAVAMLGVQNGGSERVIIGNRRDDLDGTINP
jgi:hypothetical protein